MNPHSLHLARLSLLASALTVFPAQRAHAIFGVGDIVLDPTAAVNAASQIANQVTSLANDAQGLINDAQQIYNQGQQLARQYEHVQLSLRSLEDLEFDDWDASLDSLRTFRRLYIDNMRRVELLRENTLAWFDRVYPDSHDDIVNAPNMRPKLAWGDERLDDSFDATRNSAAVGAAVVAQDEVASAAVERARVASRTAQGEKAAMQANTLMLNELIHEARSMKTVAMAAEARETTEAMRELDEARLQREQADHFNRDRDTEYPAHSATLPRRR